MESRTEPAIFRAAIAVVAVAVLDGAFLHPQPGTSASDHVVSGLVPVAAAAGLVAVYPRLPGVVRGWLSIACGALALVSGIVVGVRPAVLVGVGVSSVVGIAAAVAGAVLVASGVAVLWTTRRLDGRPIRRWVRRSAVGFLVVLCGVFLVMPIGVAIVGTHRVRVRVHPADLGAPYRAVRITTHDGLHLAGWYVPSRNRAAIIVFPGRRSAIAARARLLVRHGYGVLVVDPRGDGRSEGDYNAWGWKGELDLDAAIAYLARQRDVDPGRIGGLGLSVGGELLLQTAAHNPGLKAVISEGAGARSLAEQLDTPDVAGWRRPITPWAAQTLAISVLSNALPPPRLTALMPHIAPRAVFLISATNGNPDESLNRAYYTAAGQPKTLWELHAGGHTGGLRAAPTEYQRRVIAFFNQTLERDR